MKTRIFSLLVLLLVLSLTLAVAQQKEECSSTAAAKSCCVNGSKASMTKAGTTESTVMLASTKKADAKTVQGTTKKVECTEADKAHCDMTKASTVSNKTKMDCCKDKAKTAKAEKKSAPEKSEAKGTN
jgi:hypothetical protein